MKAAMTERIARLMTVKNQVLAVEKGGQMMRDALLNFELIEIHRKLNCFLENNTHILATNIVLNDGLETRIR